MVDKAHVNTWEAGDCPAIIGAGSVEGDATRGTFAEPGDLHKIVVYDPNGLCERLIGYIDESNLPRHTGGTAFATATAMRRTSASMQSSLMSSTTMLTSTSAVAVLDLEEVFGSAEAWQLWGNGDELSEGADIAGQQFLALGGTWQSAWSRRHHPAAGAPLHVRYGRRNSSQNRASRAGSSGGGSVDDGFVSIGYQIVDGRPVLRGIMSSTLGSSINYSDGEGFESFAERMATQRGSDLTLAERQLAEGQSPNTTRLDGQGRRVSIIPEVSTRREREESLDPSHDCTEPTTYRTSVSKPAASPTAGRHWNSARSLQGATVSPANSVHASPAELQTALVQCLQSHIQQVERQHSGASTNPQVVRDLLTDTQPVMAARPAYRAGAALQPVSPTQGLSILPALRTGRSPVASSASPVGADGRPTQSARPVLCPTDVTSLPPMPALPRISRTSLGDSQRRQRSGRRRSSVQAPPRSCWDRLKQRIRRCTGTTRRASVAGSMGQRGSPGTSKSTTPNAGSGLSRHIDPSRIASFRSKGSLASIDRPEVTMSGADLKAQRKHSLPGMYATNVVQTGWSARPVHHDAAERTRKELLASASQQHLSGGSQVAPSSPAFDDSTFVVRDSPQ